MNALRQLTSLIQGDRDPEKKLIVAAQGGDQRAFATLTRPYERPLRGFLSLRIGPSVLDDVLQETWLAAWTGLGHFTFRSRFKAWLFGIAVHKCTDYYRKRGRAEAEPIDLETAELQLGGERMGQQDAYAAIDLRHAIKGALSQLPEAQREVVEMYYYAELTLAEIATALERNLNTVKYQFYRAHTQLEQDLGPGSEKEPLRAQRESRVNER